MLAKMAEVIERHRPSHQLRETLTHVGEDGNIRLEDLIALSVENTLRHITPAAVVIPTRSGATARSIARYRPPVWITAVSSDESTCQNLMFSYGVFPVYVSELPTNWKPVIKEKLRSEGVEGNLVVLTKVLHGSIRTETIVWQFLISAGSNADGWTKTQSRRGGIGFRRLDHGAQDA